MTPSLRASALAVVICPTCHGNREVPYGHTSLNPYSGIRVLDPQCDGCEVCPRCHGDGVIPQRYEREAKDAA